MSCLILMSLAVHAQNRSLNNKVNYNSEVGKKTFEYPYEKELKIKKREISYKGNPVKTSKNTLTFDHLTLIKTFEKKDIQNISQTTKPHFGFSKNYNSYAENNVQMFGSPTANTLGAGRVNVSSHYLLFYKINVGVTDRLDIGGGFTLIPQLDDTTAVENRTGQVVSLSAKYTIRNTRHLDWAIGFNSFRIPKKLLGSIVSQRSRLLNYVYIAANADYSILNFSASIGQPFLGTVSNKFINSNNDGTGINYIFTLAGSLMLNDQLSIVIENWWVDGITNVPGMVNSNRRGVPDFPLIGGRYYSGAYGAGIGIGNFLIPGVKPLDAFYIDGFYYF